MIGCRPLSDSEIRLVLKLFYGRYHHRDRLLFVLGYSTGFRIGELLSLQVHDVWRHGKLTDHIRVQRRHVKRRRHSRSIFMPDIAKHYLEIWLGILALAGPLDGETPLFPSRKGSGRPISRTQAYRILRAAFEACELDLDSHGTHTMRKTFADRMFQTFDENIFKLQHALGHASPASTLAYLSFDEAELDQAIASTWSQPTEE
ncbi:Tyrosine recombinase XerC [subsurface metagenome]